MELVDELIARIEERRAETKNPCPTYATRAKALEVGEQVALRVAKQFAKNPDHNTRPMRYIVVRLDCMEGRFAVCFDMSELLNRSSSTGGYLGACSPHYSY